MMEHGLLIGSLYHLYVDVSVNVFEQVVNVIGSKRSRDNVNLKYMWHLKIGHIGDERINRLEKDGLLGIWTTESYQIYESYL